MTTEIKVWQSFSSNNSSDYRLIARFDEPQKALAAAEAVKTFMRAHAEEVDETGDIDKPSQAQLDLTESHGVQWDESIPLCWGDEALADDEPMVAVAGSTLVMYHTYCGGLEYGFGEYLSALGAKDLDEESESPRVAVLFSVPKGKKGKAARETLDAFFEQRDSEVELAEWEIDPPWMAAEELPYEDAEAALWFCDGTQGMFSLPMGIQFLDDLEAWFKKSGIKDYRLVLCDSEIDKKLKILSTVRRCPECHTPDPKYLPAESEALEEDQLLCDACGGMFSLASIEEIAAAKERLDEYLADKGVSRMCPHCGGSDLVLRGASGRIDGYQLLCMGCSAQVTVKEIVGASPVSKIATGSLNQIVVRGESIWVGARDGSIYRSTDGGESFKRQKKGKLQLFGLEVIGDRVVLAAGCDGVILRSVDAGRRFQEIENGASGYLFVITVAADGKTVFVPGTGCLWLSRDAGESFRKVNMPVGGYLLHVAQASEKVFYAVGHNGVILRSNNGGIKWAQQESKAKRPFCRIVTLSEDVVVAVGDGGMIVTTSNGGQTWTKRRSGVSADIEDVIVGNDGRLYAVTARGDLLIGENQGKRWSVMPSGATTHLWSISTTDRGELMMVGEGGILVRRSGIDCPADGSSAEAPVGDVPATGGGLGEEVSAGKNYLFTGKLASMSRAEAKAKAEAIGGVVKSSVTKDLDYLVVGDEGSPLYGRGKKGSKIVAAEKLIAAGSELKIISETAFLGLRQAGATESPNAAPRGKTVSKKKVVKRKAVSEAAATEGKSFLFTGKLASMSRAEAKAKVEALGGVAKSSVTKDLDFLVIGDEGSPLYGEGKKGSKMVAAEKLIAAGASLQIISETDFLALEGARSCP